VTRIARTTGIVCVFALCVGVSAQSPDKIAAARARLAGVAAIVQKLPVSQQHHLSSGVLNLVQLATGLTGADDDHGPPPITRPQSAKSGVRATAVPGTPVLVNDPTTDFLFSVLAGATQSETTTAWCGSNVVVGFNDSTSVFETELFGPGGLSFSGAGASGDMGQSFLDIGPINPGPNFNDFLAGDPVVTCGDANHFNFSQILESGETLSTNVFEPLSGAAFSKSADAGLTWGNPIYAVLKDGNTHVIDKPWHALDPQHPSHVFLTYTDFDVSGTVCGTDSSGAPVERVAIEMVMSVDGGNTWSRPAIIDEICSAAPDFPHVSGSQVVVDNQGSVYVAWEAFLTATSRELRMRRITGNGTSPGAIVKVTPVVPVGDGFLIQANIRNTEFPSLAVDRSNGTLYIVWNDGRLLQDLDFESPNFAYGYGNVFVTRSLNHGATWSSPVRVNDDAPPPPGNRGVDHFQPAVGVDQTGAVGACWYDRRIDPRNTFVARFCARSTNGGTTWANNMVPMDPWLPMKEVDAFIVPYYLGDYDQVATDTLRVNPGFLGSFGNVELILNELVPNQDVYVTRF